MLAISVFKHLRRSNVIKIQVAPSRHQEAGNESSLDGRKSSSSATKTHQGTPRSQAKQLPSTSLAPSFAILLESILGSGASSMSALQLYSAVHKWSKESTGWLFLAIFAVVSADRSVLIA